MIGKYFLDKCIDNDVENEPWPHQIISETFPKKDFDILRKECEDLDIPNDKLVVIHPGEFEKHKISFYEKILDISKEIKENAKRLCQKFPDYRWFDDLGINAHLSITPPLPYKFYIHQEGLDKIWSSVTYITPEKNVGTKMYTAQHEDAFVKEAQWQPNSTFIFCGQERKTWHSYESNQSEQRITLNLFITKRNGKCFYPVQ